MPTRPEAPVHSEEAEFLGPNDDRWYRTQIPDWIALCPQVNHTAYRLYVIIRSLILEKQPKKVRLLSHEQLAFLLPGPNGKPSGVRTVKDALQVLTEVGLISNPDGERIITSSGKGTIRTRRRYQLHDWPTAELALKVWRNAFDKLDAFTEDWRETRTDVFAGEDVGRNSAPRTEQPCDTAQASAVPTPDGAGGDVSAGQFVGRNSAKAGRDSARRRRNSARHADVTSDDATSLKQFPEGSPSSSSGGTQDSREEEEEQPSARTTGVTPLDLVLAATDATEAEARELVEILRPEAKKSLGGFIRTLADRGDLSHRLWLLRRERVPQPRTGASEAAGPDAVCAEHREPLDCPVCVVLHPRMAQRLLDRFGPVRRPDLVARLAPADASS
ncbi:hypothetical protein HUT17_05535 (plasmid) [Nocardiopsis flavescens]|nr:hypothetical protein HUT17_05460 [Nocardiopsis flavescens]QKW32597.1 hypothetical protein HUT17_05535 [Nocardiopsis flavescens]